MFGLKEGEAEAIALYFQEKAAQLYKKGKTTITAAAKTANLTVHEMVN